MAKPLSQTLAGLVAVTTLPAGLLTGLFLGFSAAAVVFIVGWLFLLPTIGIVGQHLETRSTTADDAPSESASRGEDERSADEEGPVDVLRQRYARGEIDEATFEEAIERLLATEDVEPVDDDRSADEVLAELERTQ